MSQRVELSPGKQKSVLTSAIQKTSASAIAELCKVSERTLCDWKREKYLMTLDAFLQISAILDAPAPKVIRLHHQYWNAKNAAKKGGKATMQKYGYIGGDAKHRKEKWHEWWDNAGQYTSKVGRIKKVSIPTVSAKVAEFIGIVIGDGGITRNQISITLNKVDDAQYSEYVINLIQELFGLTPGTHARETVVIVTISRKKAVEYINSLGIKTGNKIKQSIDIPSWIMQNNSYRIACLRGLIDTDGCIFQEKHKRKDKEYIYPRLTFTSYSESLRNSTFKIMKEFNFSPTAQNRRDVHLSKKEDIIQYFQIVGTSNPKHTERYKRFFGEVG